MGRLSLIRGGILILVVTLAWNLHAGGSGLNTIVVVNQNSANSVELGNYYAERRQVPPENVLRVNWTGGNISWTNTQFQSVLLTPLVATLSARGLTNQIDYVVLSMDFPFQTLNGSVVNSTTAALFYGLKMDSGPQWAGITNSYAGSEQIFRQAKPASASGPSFLTVMLTAGSLAQAKGLVDQGVNGDATFPSATVFLAKSSDALRNLRHRFFDNTISDIRLAPAANYSIARVNADMPSTSPALLGLQAGLPYVSLPNNSFVPGAMADSMTSFGGIIFGPNDQSTALTFIHAGASGSYGTVTEPQPVTDKFPNPQNYFYQSRGFNIAECYYQSLNIPFQGLIVGEPLSAPFQKPGTGSWSGVTSNAVLSGTQQLTVNFLAADPQRPLQQIDLFVDGKFNRTLTNLPPTPGNVVNLSINSRPVGMIVPAGATVGSLASSLTALINQPANTNSTKVVALAHGDRIELRSTSINRLLSPINFRIGTNTPPGTPTFPADNNVARTSIGTASALSAFVTASDELFSDSTAYGIRTFTVNGIMQVGTWLRLTVTKTNGILVTVTVTNQSVTGTSLTLASDLVTAINSSAALQGVDGLVAEDLSAWYSSGVGFNLRARTPGLAMARTGVQLTGSGLALNPPGQTTLTENLSDLQPRNHLYVTVGTTNLTAPFALNTATLIDGYHELTAVAYEGSHVQTQTRVTVPVRIQNTALNATLTLVNLTDPSPVNGTYQIQVTANTNNVSAIRLYSTGGLLGTVNSQSSATFSVTGTSLGVGLHPFYAIVETTTGLQYRTETRRVRLQ